MLKKFEILFKGRSTIKGQISQYRMPFQTDGSSHTNGVNNEKDICVFLNRSDDDPLKIKCLFGEPKISTYYENGDDVNMLDYYNKLKYEHMGGTQRVSDMDVTNGKDTLGVSIKNHKAGTFDYINTSKLKTVLPNNIKQDLENKREVLKEKYYQQSDKIEECRKELDDIINTCIDKISSDDIKKIFQIINERNPELILINDIAKKKLLCFKEQSFKELSTYPYENNTYILKSARAKLSRVIYRGEYNTNLRLRICLNNGVSALLGLSDSNSNSYFCIKIQQDKVDYVLSNTELYSSCDY